MIRRLILLFLAGVVAAVVVGDRVAAHYAEGKVASGIRDAEHLPSTPDVTIHGIPFLTQLFGGHYDDVEVTVHGFRRGGLTVDLVDAHLRGVLLPFSDVIHGDVNGVPVDRVDGAVVVTYADLASDLRTGITYSYGGGNRIRAHLPGGASVDAQPSVSGRDLTIGTSTFVVPNLPFHLHLESVTATPDGVRIVVGARHVVFRALTTNP